jgi:uncharacterized membrane protein
MAEEQSAHRQKLESKAVEGQIKDARDERVERRLGQVFALAISLAFLGCAMYLALHGHTVPSSIIGSGGVIGLASVFIHGRRSEAREKAAQPAREA